MDLLDELLLCTLARLRMMHGAGPQPRFHALFAYYIGWLRQQMRERELDPGGTGYLFPDDPAERAAYRDDLLQLLQAYSRAAQLTRDEVAADPGNRHLAQIRDEIHAILTEADAAMTRAGPAPTAEAEARMLHDIHGAVYQWHSQRRAQAYLYAMYRMVIPTGTVGSDLDHFRRAANHCLETLPDDAPEEG
ncbi:MAG TPA: hypothetical protein VKE74_22020 [Gemmataceae bacterium]|nr:hypothetical protein [Gemmataceae bacterium]